MRRAWMIGPLVVAVALFLMGCGEFRERAMEVETRIAEAEESTQLAEEAAAHNRGRLLELERRISDLEAAFDEMRTIVHEKKDTP